MISHLRESLGQRLTNKELLPNLHLRRLLAEKKKHDAAFSTINFFEVLPCELVYLILCRLDPVSLARCMLVCRLFEELLSDERFWDKLIDQDGLVTSRDARHPRARYFAHYRQVYSSRRRSVAPRNAQSFLTLFRT